jgi:hypothetical protein
VNINKAFPSKYLKAADLDGKAPNVTISKAVMEDIGDETKIVVYFEGKDKPLVLNRTNANAISDILGSDDTDDWPAKRIKLITAKVDFQGKRVPAIRIEEADAMGTRVGRQREVVPDTSIRGQAFSSVPATDDDIPF